MKSGGALSYGVGNVSVSRLRRTMPAVVAVAFVSLAAGCSLIQPSNQVLADQGQSGAASGGTSPSASSPAASVQPAWARALGAGVVVTGPAPAVPGDDSPGAAVQGEVDATTPAQACGYFPPSAQASCQAVAAQAPAGSGGSMQNFALGYVAVDGNAALVGSTGTSCSPSATPSCTSNGDAAAIFSSGKPFSVLWAEAVAADLSSANSYQLVPCVQTGGNWYVYWPFTGSNSPTGTIPVTM